MTLMTLTTREDGLVTLVGTVVDAVAYLHLSPQSSSHHVIVSLWSHKSLALDLLCAYLLDARRQIAAHVLVCGARPRWAGDFIAGIFAIFGSIATPVGWNANSIGTGELIALALCHHCGGREGNIDTC